MFLGAPPASHDRILDFSTPVTGSLFYVPTSDFLDDLPDPPAARVSEGADESGAVSAEERLPSADGSSGVGGLGTSQKASTPEGQSAP